jgi:hypothetical protein
MTICVTAGTACRAATLHSSIGRPQSGTSALGRRDPRRSPRPAATITATAMLMQTDAYLAATATFPVPLLAPFPFAWVSNSNP